MPAPEAEESTAPQPSSEQIAVLERFVVENDDLLKLEELIGRFNIFDALGIVRAEIRHSNFLAWLLDPNESHGQGSIFLRAILMDLLRQSPAELRPLNPITLDGAELRGVRVRREHGNIDILIECDDPRFVIAIENKIDSGEHSLQLSRYRNTVGEEFPNVPSQYVYLTREGDEPSDDEWTTYSYRDIHDTLRRVRRANSNSIGDDVLTFLDHYLNLIGSRFMDDPEIDELCQTIYKNHRQAIDLIIERVASPTEGLLADIEAMINHDDRWQVLGRTSRRLTVLPKDWAKTLPPIGTRPRFPKNCWLVANVNIAGKGNNRLRTGVTMWPIVDGDLRSRLIDRLTQDPREFGLSTLFKSKKKVGGRFTALGQIIIARWSTDELPNNEECVVATKKALEKRYKQLVGVSDALRPIIEEWERERTGGNG